MTLFFKLFACLQGVYKKTLRALFCDYIFCQVMKLANLSIIILPPKWKIIVCINCSSWTPTGSCFLFRKKILGTCNLILCCFLCTLQTNQSWRPSECQLHTPGYGEQSSTSANIPWGWGWWCFQCCDKLRSRLH